MGKSQDIIQGDKSREVLELNLESLIFEVEQLKNRVSKIEGIIEKIQGSEPNKVLITGADALEQYKGISGRPSQYYNVIKEYYLRGYSYSKISEFTGASYSTVAKTVKKLKGEGIIREDIKEQSTK